MNTQATQFYVAIVAIGGLVVLAAIGLVCAAFGPQQRQVIDSCLLLMVGGLVSGAGAAVAYLFRLNGKATMSGKDSSTPPA